LLAIMKYMSRPKSAAVKDVDIADILSHKYQYHIDIGKDDIDPPVIWRSDCMTGYCTRSSTVIERPCDALCH